VGNAGEQPISNKVDAYTKKGVGQIICSALTFFGKPHGSENSFVVRQIHIPFYEVDSVLYYQSAMQIKMIFKMTKEPFYSICGGRYFRIGQIVKHIGQCSFNSKV
jgi:hypothetical protein